MKEIIDIDAMSESLFEAYLYMMPRCLNTMFELTMKYGTFADWIDALAFMNCMHKITRLKCYDIHSEEYEEMITEIKSSLVKQKQKYRLLTRKNDGSSLILEGDELNELTQKLYEIDDLQYAWFYVLSQD